MSTTELLQQLKAARVKLSLKDGKLSVNAPKGALTPELRERLKASRDELIELLSAGVATKASETPALPLADRNAPLPLSYAQQRFWFLEEFEGGSSVYNIPWAARLRGALNPEALQAAIEDLALRHESLRTTFRNTDNGPVQDINSECPITIERISLPGANDSELRSRVEELAATHFDLANGPLMRVAVIEAGRDDWVLCFVIHHIIIDGWSLDVLQNELFAFYSARCDGKPLQLAPLPLQMADYASWQRSLEGTAVIDAQLGYWKEQLRGAPPVIELPTDRPRPAEQSYAGAKTRRQLPGELSRELKEMAGDRNATLFMLLMAAFQVLLARYSGQDDIVVGTPVAGRQRTELEGLIGLLLNTLAIRGDLSGDPTFTRFLEQISERSLDAFANQDLPFDRIVDKLGTERNLSHTPVFQVQFVLQNTAGGSESAYGLQFAPLEFDYGTSKFDLTLAVAETPQGIATEVEFSTALFDHATVERLLAHFEVLLTGIVANPDLPVSRLPLLEMAERRHLLTSLNDTAVGYPTDVTLQSLVEKQVALTPDATALIYEDAELSYAELNSRANQVAHWLRAQGIGADDMVGVYMERSVEMVVALLGIVKAGGAYVPFDPEYPEQRLQHMLEDAGMTLILSQSHLADQLPPSDATLLAIDDTTELKRSATSDPVPLAGPDNLAYVIFTSGSTGRPKGVMNEHRGICNRLLWMQDEYELNADDRVLQKTPFSFDVSVWEFFWPLLSGATMVIARPGGHKDSDYLCELIRDRRVTTLHFVPSMLQVFLQNEAARSCTSLQRVICSGEALSHDLQTRFYLTLDAGLHNLYGPTEAAIDVTYWACRRDSRELSVPIGHPVANTLIYIVEPNGEPAPQGVAGELWIGGVQVARGYANRPDLTAERFIPDPFAADREARVYRTGDLARYRNDGAIEFLGRIDHQVKLRGFRIELGEIEAGLDALPAVEQSLVLLREDVPGNKQLVAYVTGTGGQRPDTPQLRDALKATLPDYMVPAAFVALDEFPLLPNGKVDRKALPEPEGTRDVGNEYVPPGSQIEKALAGIWGDLLRVDRVGVHDNFFELGGDSILSIQIITRAGNEGIHLTPKQVFRYQTVAELAAVAGTTGRAVAEQGPVTGAAPLTPVQHWFFATTPVDPHHFNQSLRLQLNQRLEHDELGAALQTLLAHHDALRLRFTEQRTVWQQQFGITPDTYSLRVVDVSELDDDTAENAVIDAASEMQGDIDLDGGTLLHALLIERGAAAPQQLIIAIHHLAVDGVSWRILLEDLETACQATRDGTQARLPAKTSSFRDWAIALENYSQSDELAAERAWWLSRDWPDSVAIPVDHSSGNNTMASLDNETISLSSDLTRRLLQEAPRAYRTQINDLLLSALARAWQRWSGLNNLLVDLEGHGREDKFADLDVSRTVGWFTSIYPVCLQASAGESAGATIKRVKESLREIPDKGFGYGVLRYLTAPAMAEVPHPQVMFNYLGQFDQTFDEDATFDAVEGSRGYEQSPQRQRTHLLEINGSVFDGRLNLAINYSRNRHDAATIARFAECFKAELTELVEHCAAGTALGYTPSDFPLASVSQTVLDALLHEHRGLADIYPVSPMQHGMLFHSLIADDNTAHSGQVYVTQVVWDLEGKLDAHCFEQAWQQVLDRHTALRTSFHAAAGDIPLAIVHERATISISKADWQSLSENERAARLTDVLNQDREQGYELERAPLMRLYLFDCGNEQFKFVWSHHHIIIDGWSIPVLLNELFATYDALTRNETPALGPTQPYRDYIDWLHAQDRAEAERYWRETLAGFNAPTPLPGAQQLFRGVQEEHDFDRYFATLSETETKALRELARQSRLTLNTLAQGLWSLMISRFTGSERVLFGATTSGRPAELRNVESIIGLFLNTVPVYTTLHPQQTARDWLATVQDGQLSARQFEYASLTDIQGWSEVPRGTPLFHSLMIFENYPDASALWEDRNAVRIKDMQSVGWTNFPLSAAVSVGSQLVLRLSYDLGYYTPAAAAQVGETYLGLLRALIAQPDSSIAGLLQLPAPARRDQQPAVHPAKEFEFFATGGTDGNIPHRFASIAARYPDADAVRSSSARWSYRELDARANAVAQSLIEASVAPGDRVGLLLNHDAPMIAGLLGTLKAGATYVPLDPGAPPLRLQAIARDADLRAIVTVAENTELADELAGINTGFTNVVTVTPDADLQSPAPQVSIEPDALAYILFTSGSTGTPKGVMQTHRNALHQIATYTNSLHLASDDRLALFSPYGFDAAVQDIFGALLNGASVSPISLKTAETPATLVDRISDLGITVFHATPTVYRYLFAQHDGSMNDIRIVVLGGEEARPDDLQLFRQRFTRGTTFVNGLGLTESTMTLQYFADHDTPVPSDTLPAGTPVSGLGVRLLDENGNTAVLSGEICIRSPYLTPGYWNAPELTAERFSRDGDGVPLFRTGDMARYDIDGNLIFAGRADTQLKVRGNRIEAGEIEAALRSHPAVAASVVLLLPDVNDEPRLTAYVTGADRDPDSDTLRAHLRERVPDYMVPAAIVCIPEIPLLPNGKLDRGALPRPDAPAAGAERVAPRNPTEATLAAIWQDILGVEDLGVTDDFFGLGGHSLIATQLMARVRDGLDCELPLRALFDQPTIAGLAELIDSGTVAKAAPALIAVPEAEWPASIPLSFSQQRLWFLDQLEPGSTVYTLTWATRLQGDIDPDALERAFNTLAKRHAVLRTRFGDNGDEPVQIIPATATIPFHRHAMPDAADGTVNDRLAELFRTPFDLASGPLLRVHLIATAPNDHVLMVMIHHIISDAWSNKVLMQELGVLYAAECAGTTANLPPLPAQYADYAIWQRNWLQGAELNRQVSYWKDRLTGAPFALDLPTDRPRPPVQTFNGDVAGWEIDRRIAAGLKRLANEHGSTLYMVLIAAYGVLLGRHSNQSDLLIGTPIAGRRQTELEKLIGFFVNTLVMRSDFSDNPSFEDFLQRVRRDTLDAFAHQEIPFEKLVEELQPDRDQSRSPLFQAAFILQNTPVAWSPFEGITSLDLNVAHHNTKFDLTLVIWEADDNGLHGYFEFNTDLYDRSTVDALIRRFNTLLDGIVNWPRMPVQSLPLIDNDERRRLLIDKNATEQPYPDATTLHGLFAESAAGNPDKIAVEFAGGSLTYREIDRQSNRLARRLQSLGAAPDQPIALCTERTADLVIGVLGVLKSGAPYVPLDPAYPDDRIAYMLQDSGAKVLVTVSELENQLPTEGLTVLCADTLGDWEEADALPPATPDLTDRHLAYIIYTSGSTGKPKGVQIEHRSAVNFIAGMTVEPGFGPNDRLLAVTTLCFDISVLELMLPLACGGTLLIATRDQAGDGEQLQRLLDRDITMLQATPATWRLLLQSGWQGHPRLQVLCGGEALERDLANELHQRSAGVWNMYGPTETTVWSSCHRYDPTDTWIAVGTPISNMRYYVLDQQQQPVPEGVAGELYVGGDGVARGYRDRPQLTAEKFLTDPFAATAGARMYRTGDLARYLPDNNLQVLGRTDFQVKLRGFRIELGEIENAMQQHPHISQAVVVLREDSPGDQRLVGYFTGAETTPHSELRSLLQSDLPDYMVPAAFLQMDELPLTPNGKVDRKALPAPEYTATSQYVAPRDATEETLCAIWGEILGLEQVGIDDNFFMSGGHSLLATRLIARVRSQVNASVELRALFNQPTVREFAAGLSDTSAASLPPITPVDTSDGVPLSFAQQRLWFLDQLEPGNPVYNIPLSLILRGPLNKDALQVAVDRVCERHSVLRTRFVEQSNEPVQLISKAIDTRLRCIDVAADTDTVILQQMSAIAAEPFDLSTGPLIRVTLLEKTPALNYLSLVIHHTVADGWSLNVFFSELLEVYGAICESREATLPDLPVQYADYAAWQRDWLQGEELQRQTDFWRTQLAGAPELIELPLDHPRPPVQTFNGALHFVECSAATRNGLHQLANDQGATLYMVMLSALAVLLARHTGQDDIVIGTPIAGRQQADLEGLIGFFVNTLALRTRIDGNPSYTDLLQQVREVALDAFEHQQLPFEKLVEELQPARNMSHSPIFQVLFNLHNEPWEAHRFAGLEADAVRSDNVTAKFDLSVNVDEYGDGLRIALEYNTDLFATDSVARLGDHFARLLEAIVATPELPVYELKMLDNAEIQQLTRGWNDTAHEFSVPATLHGLFEASVVAAPDQIAVNCDGFSLTYRDLNKRANQLAHELCERGAGPDVPIALCCDRGVEMLIGALGILKSGSPYVPLDPSYPTDRIAYMLEDSGASVMVTTADLRKLANNGVTALCIDALSEADIELSEAAAHPPEVDALRPDHLAYIIYTSGSTGKPKGVQIEHRNATNFIACMADQPGFTVGSRLLAVTTLCFDISVLELFLPLYRQGTVVIATREQAADGYQLSRLLNHVDVMQATPATWRLLIQSGWEGNPKLVALCGGEALERDLAEQIDARVAALWNMYGPTEATVWASVKRFDKSAGRITVGRPIANYTCYILDEHQQPVPLGVNGELYIGGAGVARGYRNRAELTAERFIPDPFASTDDARLYRTGDLARFTADGEVQILGRTDFQVKLRGFRIELGEIEAALSTLQGVAQSVVVLREDTPGDKRLVAYHTGTCELTNDELRSALKTDLPEYMVPSAYVRLDELPLTPNGKLDRKALPIPDVAAVEYTAPRNDTESQLCEIWAAVLRVDRVGIHDDFFALGGHSLLGTQLIARVRDYYSAAPRLRDLFMAPTVAEFALSIDTYETPDGVVARATEAPLTPVAHPDGAPLSFAQQRLWFLDQMEPGNPVYNIPLAVELRGPLNKAALQQALDTVVERHAVLRTRFAEHSTQPVQLISSDVQIALRSDDVAELDEAAIRRELSRLAALPFDLAKGPLLRVHVLEKSADVNYLSIVIHHIAADGWSLNLFFSELLEGYSAECGQRSPQLPYLPVQYADFAVWQREQLSGRELERQLDFWRDSLAGAPELTELPTDFPRPALQTFNGDVYSRFLSDETSQALNRMAGEQGSTLFMLLLAALNVLLARHTGQNDVVVGTPVAGRQRSELEPLIGVFINTLALRTQFERTTTFRELLQRVRNTALDAFENQGIPFEKLVEELQPARNLSHSPIFQVLFNLHNEPWDNHAFSDLEARSIREENVAAKFDLSVNADEYTGRLRISFEYNTDLFRAATIRRLSDRFVLLLDTIAQRIDAPVFDLPLLTSREYQQVTREWNATAHEFDIPTTLHGLFEHSAALTPDAIAVRCGSDALTYNELNQRANLLGHRLQRLGAGPDIPVALCTDRSIDMLTGVLGILKSGAAYVPVDPSYPPDRIDYMLTDCGAEILVTQSSLADSLVHARYTTVCVDEPAAADDSVSISPDCAAGPDDLAYVIYTSGSTGNPKGVRIEHRNATNFIAAMTKTPGFSEGASLLAVTTMCFDISVLEMFLPLWRRGTVVIATREQAADGYALQALLNQGIDVLQATPATWRMLLAAGWEGTDGLTALCGGEALERDLAERIHSRTAALWNMYGPTEATVWSSVRQYAPDDTVITVGKPLPNYTYYILDEQLQPVPPGVNGELFIGGTSVARDYLDRPELTAERFINDPFSTSDNARLYRTGDLACFRDDGDVQILGRTDFQVKLRGFRIELGEIEATLTGLDGVAQAIVVLREDVPGDKRLVAYLTGDNTPNGAEIRAMLKGVLPDYMVPSGYVRLTELPLTPNGKVDRKALPVPEAEERAAATPPRNDLEAGLCRLWGETLRVDTIGIHDDFFALGGHSLLGTQLIARVRNELGGSPQLRDLFTAPSVAEFAATLDTSDTRSPEGLELQPTPHTDGAPLSFAQQRLWFLDQMEPGNPVYNIPLSVHLQGQLDTTALQTAVDIVTKRHEILRTRFVEIDAEPIQMIDPDARVTIERYTLQNNDHDTVAGRIAAIAAQPFALDTGPLWRVTLGEFAASDYYLTIVMHHTISDGWSINIMLSELLEAFSAAIEQRPPALRDLPVQYADYAIWQREWLAGAELERQTRYWRTQLEGAPALLELPTDRPRPPVQTYNGDFYSHETSAETAAGLRELAAREGCTLYMVMLAATNVLFARHAGQDDIVIGTPVAGRKHTELEGLIGFFINTLALRNDLSGNPQFTELLARVRSSTLDAFEHQEMPFEKLVEELQLPRNLSHTPVFQVMFNLHNQPWDAHEFTGIDARGIKTRRNTSKFDLSVHVDEHGAGLRISFEYNTDLFDRNSMALLMQRFQCLLDGIAAAPEQTLAELPLGVTAPQTADGPVVNESETLAGLFEQQVDATPDRPAVRCGSVTTSYAELNQQANSIAYALRDAGLVTGCRAGLLLEHNQHTIAGILGALKVGTAYVPLDPHSPDTRLADIAEDAGITALVCTPGTAEQARRIAADIPVIETTDYEPGETPLVNPSAAACADDLAYILFTSGSTGKPKGVMQTHGRVISHVRSYIESCSMDADDNVSLFSTYGFDASVQDIFGALLTGACVHPFDLRQEDALDGTLNALALQKISVLHATPTVFRFLFASVRPAQDLTSVRAIILGGEETRADDFALFCKLFPAARFINGFGMTESTMVTQHHMKAGDHLTTRTVPVGLPVPGTAVILRDRRGAESMLCGEICVQSDRLTPGYWQDDIQTAARLRPVPGRPDQNRLLTGDQARRLIDGSIIFSGREDDQVKIRGHRIELQEIALAAESLHDVTKCAVLVDDQRTSGERLLAYVTLRDGANVDVGDIRAALREKLPPYMLPASIMTLSEMPLTRSGKIDRKALPAYILQRDDEVSYAPPVSATQKTIAHIWTQLLDVDNPGIHDDFFALGGHSLLTIRMLREIEQETGQRLTIASIFEGPTIDRIASLIDSGEQSEAPARSVIMPIKTSGSRPPLFCIDGEPTRMAGNVHEDQPIYSIYHAYDPDFVAPEKIEDLARIYIEKMREIQPHGPYHLAGFCVGGLVGFEMGNQLRAAGEEVAYLAMIDPTIPGWRSGNRAEWVRRSFAQAPNRWRTLRFFARRAFSSLYARTGYTQRLFRGWLYRKLNIELPLRLRHIQNAGRIRESHTHYRYHDVDQQAQVFLIDLGESDFRINEEFWKSVFTQGADVRTIRGLYHHAGFLTEPFISNITRIIDARLGELNDGD